MKRPRFPKIDPKHASVLIGIVAAVVVAVLVNVVAARRYSRWDWTTASRYTLSPATVQTLHDLSDTVQVWVLLGSDDALSGSVKPLLVAYQAETTKLEVHYIDPDRDTAAFEDLRQKFRIETARTDQGLVTDAIAIVARGDKHWFLRPTDMVEMSPGDETRVKPKEERALTSAIRNVLGGDKTRLCFTTGHGEMSPVDPGEQGAGLLKEVLDKDNYQIDIVDAGAPNVAEPFQGCSVAIVAGMRGAFTKDEAERLRTWLLGGGNALFAVSPIAGETSNGMTRPELERVLAPFGIALDEDLVIEQDPEVSFPDAGGLRFMAAAQKQAITAGLVKTEPTKDVPRVIVHFSRSMRKIVEPGSATPENLLTTSPHSFGLTSIVGASEWKDTPQKRPGDVAGPLTVAMASERPKTSPTAARGPRVVVFGTASIVTSPTFREPLPTRGAALAVENAISWLASKPQVLDIPDKPEMPAGIRLTDDDRSELRRYLLLFMPGAFALAGILVAVVRRRGEGRKRKPKE